MKKLFSLFLFLTCTSLASLQAQGVYVTGNVTDGNGNPVTNVEGSIEGGCNGIYDSLFVDNQGYYNYFLEDSCTQGTVWVVFTCPNGNIGEAIGSFTPNTQTLVLDIVLDCGPTNPTDSCWVDITYSQGDFAPWWTFVADAGVLPANTAYAWSPQDGATLVDPNSASSNQADIQFPEEGVYTICVEVVDLTTGDELCGNCITVIYPNADSSSCDVTFYQNDSLGYTILESYVTGGTAPYAYEWYMDGNVISTNAYLDMANTVEGTYDICLLVTGADGLTCEYCDTVTIGGQNSGCWVQFEHIPSDPAAGNGLLVPSVEGGVSPYTYSWSDGSTSSILSLDNHEPGTYTFCLTVTDSNGDSCEYCDIVTVEGEIACYVEFEEIQDSTGTYLYAWNQETGPYVYTWSDGTTGQILDLSDYAPGTYTFCVSATDTDGVTCDYCDVVTIGTDPVDECLDWNVIDLANAPCNFDYDPVCGCDGIEYVNSCVAYYCYGILEWTDGPCDYTGGGNGGNGEPTDSLCGTTAEFFYYGELNVNGAYDMFFFGFGENTDAYVWDMGDGTTYTGEFADHTYGVNAQDSIQAYTVCLTTLSNSDSCSATICETIVLDSTPGGFIGGEVVDGEGFVAGGGADVERVTDTEGDPLSEITVELLDWNGNVIASTTTNEQGEYAFSGLQFGDYFVHVKIDGADHTPDHVKLSPVSQNVDNNSYEVVEGQVISGIDGVSFAAGIHVSPNPTSGQLNIALDLSNQVDIRIVVMDVLGKVVRQETNNYSRGSQVVELDLEELVSGIYMVSLQANGEIYTTKVLKQ